MKRGALLGLIPLSLSALVNHVGSAAPAMRKIEGIIELDNSRDIAEAEAVNSAIDAMANSAASCRQTTSRTPLECECDSRPAVLRLRTAYDVAIDRHPGWAQFGKTVWWIDPRTKHSIALNFSAVTRLLGVCKSAI